MTYFIFIILIKFINPHAYGINHSRKAKVINVLVSRHEGVRVKTGIQATHFSPRYQMKKSGRLNAPTAFTPETELLCTLNERISVSISDLDHSDRRISQMKHQLDATLCRFYISRVTLHVLGVKRPSSGVFKISTAATGTCVIVAGQSSHLLIRAGTPALIRRCDDLQGQ